MPVDTAQSIALAAVLLALVGPAWLLARAPGWEGRRPFALLALTAGVFAATDVAFTLPGAGDGAVVVAGRVGGAAAALHVLGWVLYARTSAGLALRAADRALVVVLAACAALFLVPGAVYPGEVVEHAPWPWRNPLRLPATGPLAPALYAAMLGALLYALASWARAWEPALGRSRLRAAAVAAFAVTAAIEALVAAHVVEAPLVLELGFGLIVLAEAVEMLRRFAADARRLGELSGRLEAEVGARTEALVAARAELAEAERLAQLGRIAAGVAHEVNNPLAFVGLNLRELRDQLQDRPELAALAAEALDGADRISRIVDDLRVLARQDEEPDPVADLGAALSDAVRVLRHRVPRGSVLELPTEALPAVRGSRHRLAQVFVNLLSNALESRGGAPVRVAVTVRAEDGRVGVDVVDDGPGIPPDRIARAFEPFVTTKAGRGTGLGLAICRALVEAAGGRIALHSDGRAGTRVSVELLQAHRPARTPPVPSPRDVGPRRVLVVEDEVLVARAVQRALRPWAVEIAGTGAEALERLLDRGETYDAVLCDLLLPDLHGREVFARVQAARPELARRFVFASGGDLEGGTRAMAEARGLRWLPKPYRPEDLRGAVIGVSLTPGPAPERAARG